MPIKSQPKSTSTEVEFAKKEVKEYLEEKLESHRETVLQASGPRSQVINHRLKVIAHLAAMGMKPADIASQLGVSSKRVSAVLSSESMKAEVDHIYNELFIKDPQKFFLKILPKAAQTAYEIMTSTTAKESTRADAAFKFMDRALGKPTQEIEHKGSALKDLFALLDQKAKPKVIDIKPDVAEAIVVSEQSNDASVDEMDAWLKDNL